jgi:hypothetical protein
MDEVRGRLWWWTGGVRAIVRQIGTRREKDNSGKRLYVASYICSRFFHNISKPLIIFEINLMVNKSGPLMNHLIDDPF